MHKVKFIFASSVDNQNERVIYFIKLARYFLWGRKSLAMPWPELIL
ncbi:hypothetical protein [Christiangramia antarctica]|uniref:Uncharacterized protein n=1 Tax=Christiangramia antarctica TaxID=2058158 RepID=A0ABW5X3Y5_9FLAO